MLYQEGAVSRVELDKSELEWQLLNHDREQAQKQLQLAAIKQEESSLNSHNCEVAAPDNLWLADSLLLALIILATVLLSSSGALYSLFITRTPLGFMALMGIVSLAGVVVRNGVILIEFMEQKLRAGIDLDEAVQQAGAQRLQPILLTVCLMLAPVL